MRYDSHGLHILEGNTHKQTNMIFSQGIIWIEFMKDYTDS